MLSALRNVGPGRVYRPMATSVLLLLEMLIVLLLLSFVSAPRHAGTEVHPQTPRGGSMSLRSPLGVVLTFPVRGSAAALSAHTVPPPSPDTGPARRQCGATCPTVSRQSRMSGSVHLYGSIGSYRLDPCGLAAGTERAPSGMDAIDRAVSRQPHSGWGRGCAARTKPSGKWTFLVQRAPGLACATRVCVWNDRYMGQAEIVVKKKTVTKSYRYQHGI